MSYEPDAVWYCFVCNCRQRLGSMDMGGRPGRGFRCAKCGSDNTHPMDTIYAFLDDYHQIKRPTA